MSEPKFMVRMLRILALAPFVLTLLLCGGCFPVAAVGMGIDGANPLNYRTLHVTVFDATTGKTISDLQIRTPFGEQGIKTDRATTDKNGVAVLHEWKYISPPAVYVESPDYWEVPKSTTVAEVGGRTEVKVIAGPPEYVGSALVVPDDWRGMVRVGEYGGTKPTSTVLFSAPQHKVEAYESSDYHDRTPTLHALAGETNFQHPRSVYRIVSASTKSGKAVPVYRDASPADGRFGLYFLGYLFSGDPSSGFAEGIFFLGTLEESRKAAAALPRNAALWPNDAVIGGKSLDPPERGG